MKTQTCVVVLSCAFVASASGQISMSVLPSSAPNFFGSPSWASYLSNGMAFLENGGAQGDPSTDPTAYRTITTIDNPGDMIVSNFNSWRGVVGPGAPFGSELGNRVHFGLNIKGNGTKFRLENLLYDMTSDNGDLDFAGSFAGSNYSSTRIGIDYGTDGIKGTGDDVVISSGPATQLVDELTYIGVGNAYDASTPGGSTFAQNVASMNDTIDYIDSLGVFTFATTYTLLDDGGATISSGTGSVLVPAPASAAVLGVLGVAAVRRRR